MTGRLGADLDTEGGKTCCKTGWTYNAVNDQNSFWRS